MVDRDAVMDALRRVQDPELGRDLVQLGMVREVHVSPDEVFVQLALTMAGCPFRESIRGSVEEQVREIAPGMTVRVSLSVMTPEERERLTRVLSAGMEDRSSVLVDGDTDLRVLAVASGKGGVGKSTLAANLARALGVGGCKVGLMDADIQGFTAPLLLKAGARPRVVDGAMEPNRVHGIQVMSMGFFVDQDQAVLWRGPMLMKAVDQFIRDVRWDRDLDYLVIDLPPGTGDVPMTITARLPSAEMLLVTLPESASVTVAARTAALADRMDIPLLGVVENMSYMRCVSCTELLYPFGRGGGESLARQLGVPLLAQIPIDDRRDCSDRLLVDRHDSAAGEAIRNLAVELME